jgi:hypothetical protein
MPTVDFGSVTLSVDVDRIEVFFPFEHGELRGICKKFKAHFNGERKSWVIIPSLTKNSEDNIVDAIDRELWSHAPKGWRDAVSKFSAFACVSKKYAIKFGAGGLRISLPAGHVANWTLHEMMKRKGRQPRETVWNIPARDANSKIVMPLIKRMADEDKAEYHKATDPYAGRTTKGTLHILPEEADKLGLIVGDTVIAEFSFVKAADPTIVPMPIHCWPFLVTSRNDKPGQGYEDLEYGVEVTLTYPESGKGHSAVRKMMAVDGEGYPRRLDAPDVLGKWHSRNKR